jgi:uncharacterized Tic20 family protein
MPNNLDPETSPTSPAPDAEAALVAPELGPPTLPQEPPSQPPLPVAQLPSDEERTLAMVCHLLGILTGFLGPLVLWLVKKDSSKFIDHHGREALNFQLTVMIVMMVLGMATVALMFILVGFLLLPLLPVVGVLVLVVEIVAAVAAQGGQWYRYPCCIRFV